MDYELPLTVDTGRGFSINYRGQSLYSLYNPSKTPERIALTEKLEEETLYILPSPLLFYGVGILLSRLPESSFLLGIECDQKLMKLSLNNSGVLEHKQFELVRLDTREQLKQMFDNLGVWRFRRCKAIFLNKGYNINNEIYDYLIDYAVHHLNTFWKNRLTLNKLGSLWIKNLFQNLSVENSATPDNKGKPVIICGAGPSLEGVIDLLKGYRDKIYILAVDTALSTLLDRQIIPDLVYALESQFYNLGDFHNTGNHVFSLLADITSYPHICRTNKGPVFFTQTDFAETILLRRLKESGLSLIHLPPLGSVGVAAVYAAMTIFSEQLYLTGLDFSYVPGKSHSKGSPFVKSILRNIDRLHPLENSSGFNRRPLMRIPGKLPEKQILTDSILSGYGKLLREILRHTNRVFDLSGEGYPLGIPLISKDEFIQTINHKKAMKPHSSEQRTEKNFDSHLFLQNELSRLNDIICIWESFVQSGESEIPHELLHALEEVDYIYIDFPDKLPHPVNELSFVTRAVKKAREYSGLLQRILNQ